MLRTLKRFDFMLKRKALPLAKARTRFAFSDDPNKSRNAIASACLGAVIFLAEPAVAQTPPLLCDGRYAQPQEMLDAAYGKYGTLYSGGQHWHGHDDVRASVDLYRLWLGLPDLEFRKTHLPYQASQTDRYPIAALRKSGGDWFRPALIEALDIALSDSPEPIAPAKVLFAMRMLDLGTTLGPSPDWWLWPQLPSEGYENLSIVAELMARHDLLDWLQTILPASAAPWAIASHLGPRPDRLDVYRTLRIYADDRISQQHSYEWTIAAFLYGPRAPDGSSGRHLSYNEGRHLVNDWRKQILACTATAQTYAAFAVAMVEAMRVSPRQADEWLKDGDLALLPKDIRQVVVTNSAMNLIYRWGAEPDVDDRLSRMARQTDDPALRAWVNVGRTYLAGSIDDLIAVHDGAVLDRRTIRALNVLSVDHLMRFARAASRTSDHRALFLQVAYLRLLALRRDAEAAALIRDIAPLLPDQQAQIERIMGRSWPLGVRLSLVALELPQRSVWLTRGDVSTIMHDAGIWQRHRSADGYDLPLDYRNAAFLQRDLESWLLLPGRWGAYRGMRGYGFAALDRAHARGIDVPPGQRHDLRGALVPDGPMQGELPFTALIALAEISRLSPAEGLSQRISEEVIAWADEGSDSWVERRLATSPAMPDALRKVVMLNQYRREGQVNGLFAGQAAFVLLHRRFPESAAAAATDHWHRCDRGCER